MIVCYSTRTYQYKFFSLRYLVTLEYLYFSLWYAQYYAASQNKLELELELG